MNAGTPIHLLKGKEDIGLKSSQMIGAGSGK
jgi:hypothetical protein